MEINTLKTKNNFHNYIVIKQSDNTSLIELLLCGPNGSIMNDLNQSCTLTILDEVDKKIRQKTTEQIVNGAVKFRVANDLKTNPHTLEITTADGQKFPSNNDFTILVSDTHDKSELNVINNLSRDEALAEINQSVKEFISKNTDQYIDKVATEKWIYENNFKPKEAVKTESALPFNAEKNEIRLVQDDNKQYVFDGSKWIEFGAVKLDGLTDVDKNLKTTKNRLLDLEKNVNRSIVSTSGRKFPMITFIDDDGNVKVLEKWEPVLKEKKNKLTIAVVSSWVDNQEPTVMDWSTLHRLNREYGVEMVSHTHEHKHAQQLTDEEVEKEFREAQKVLKREGFTHNVIVQPFGENTKSVRTISRDYARANIATKEGINTLPLDTFRLNRVSLGESVNNTWEYYKSRLDEAIESNGWIIFKSHSQYESFNQEQIELIKQIIDYSREKKMMEVTVEEALNRIGNLIDGGDYTDKAGTSEYFVLDAEGKLHARTLSKDYYTLKFNSSNIDTPVTSFPAQATSITPIISTKAAPFPTGKPGMLITVSSIEPSTSYQEYVPSNSETLYRRRWDKVNNKWLPFVKIIDGMVEEVVRHYAKQTIVPANSTIETVITNAQLDLLNFNVGHMLQATPEKLLPDGIIFNAYILEANKITIRYANVTGSTVTVPALFFRFRISK